MSPWILILKLAVDEVEITVQDESEFYLLNRVIGLAKNFPPRVCVMLRT